MDKQALLDCWTMFRRENDNVSVDRVVCDPKLREQFIASATDVCGCHDEQQVLWALMGLRKSKQLTTI